MPKRSAVKGRTSRMDCPCKQITKRTHYVGFTTFYTNYIFGDEFANDSVIAKYCTKNLAQELSKAYDDEFSDGGGYAVWKFRSDAQDGEDIREIEKIEPLGDGKYTVHYNDMGNKGTHTITIVQQDGEIFFDKLD